MIQEGVGSLFRGLSASLLGISNAVIYFYIYESMRHKIVEEQQSTFNSFYVFVASIVAKSTIGFIIAIASVITYPFIVVRTIMQDHRTQERFGFREVVTYVYTEKGIKGFYRGLKPDLYRLLPSNTIVFLVYEYLKRVL